MPGPTRLDQAWGPLDLPPVRFVFVMDPIDRINIDGDSTFVLMLEAQMRGHEVLYAQPRDLFQRGGDPWVMARSLVLQRVRGHHFSLGEPEPYLLNELDAVFMRKDPPFDLDYLLATWILDRVDRRVVMVNDPQGIRDFNEKMSALRWPELMPPSLVAADRAVLRAFIAEHGRVVVKPLVNSGGAGVILLHKGDRNIGSVLDLLTVEGSRYIEAQAYLEAVKQGDKRIILLGGKPAGAINRVPQADDIRANMHAGGRAEPVVMDARDYEICSALESELVQRGLLFVGLDVIGGFLTEINVTSPTGLQEIARFTGVHLEQQLIDLVEQKRAIR